MRIGFLLVALALASAGAAELVAEADRLVRADDPPVESLRRAVALYEQAAELEPRDAPIQVKLAGACLDLGARAAEADRDAALAAFERGEHAARRAVALDDANADAHFLIAANRGRAAKLLPIWKVSPLIVSELEKDVLRAIALNPRHARALHMEAMLLLQTPAPLRALLQGKKRDAERYLTAAVDADPRFAPARLDLAEYYLDAKRFDEARAQLRAVLASATDRRHRADADVLLRKLP